MLDLSHLLSSPDVNWWTGVVWITCGLLWCFYQLFGLSLWRHPFTAEHPLVECSASSRFTSFPYIYIYIYIYIWLRLIVHVFTNHNFDISDSSCRWLGDCETLVEDVHSECDEVERKYPADIDSFSCFFWLNCPDTIWDDCTWSKIWSHCMFYLCLESQASLSFGQEWSADGLPAAEHGGFGGRDHGAARRRRARKDLLRRLHTLSHAAGQRDPQGGRTAIFALQRLGEEETSRVCVLLPHQQREQSRCVIWGFSWPGLYQIYVTVEHKTSHKGQFFEIEIYTSSGWINKLSVDVWFVMIGQYLVLLFENLESEGANKSKYWENVL